MSDSLDALGVAARAGSPRGLEERVAKATLPLLREGVESLGEGASLVSGAGASEGVRHTGGRRVGSRRHARPGPRRLAIALGLGAVVGVAAWLTLSLPTGQSGPRVDPAPIASAPDAAAEFEAMLAASSLIGGFDDRLDELTLAAASVGLTLTDPLGGRLDSESGDSNSLGGESL
ncbi:MAG: hypothetical protein KDA05_08360 [Phycisphaerales bacterium]|nr:hypothetical protein [Phycisphaerales bacterium]